MKTLKWIREGDSFPPNMRLLRVMLQEGRPEGTGTASARWLLCEFELLKTRTSSSQETGE